MNEIWMTCVCDGIEFPKYEVSDQGRVRRLWSHKQNTILRPDPCRDGYKYVQLRKAIAPKTTKAFKKPIHKIVMHTFVGPHPPNENINHEDGVKHNNYLTNLKYMTRQENMDHAVANGLIVPKYRQGSGNPRAKLQESDIPIIRQRLKTGESLRSIGNDYGITRTAVSAIKSKRSWSHI